MTTLRKRDLPDSYYAPWWVWMPLASVWIGEVAVLGSRAVTALSRHPKWGEAGAIAAIACIVLGVWIIVAKAMEAE